MLQRTVTLTVLVAAVLAQQPPGDSPHGFTTAPQCRCADIESCSEELTAKTNACKTNAQCMNYLSKIGDAAKIEQCLEKDHQVMLRLELCAKKKVNGELGCTNSATPQNLTIPLIPVVEVPAMDDGQQAAPGQGAPQGPQGPPELNQYLMCVDQCSMEDMDIIPGKRKKRSPVNCAFKLKCALAPPSEKIQNAYTECEKELNIDPRVRMGESCSCLKQAGVAIQC